MRLTVALNPFCDRIHPVARSQGDVPMTCYPPRLFSASRTCLIAVGFFLLFPLAGRANNVRSKTDIVYMRNGDKITCEVKSLSQGQLSIKPDYTSESFVVDWNKVARIESRQQFVITAPNGAYYVGTLSGNPSSHTVTIVSPNKVTLPQNSVIEITELNGSFVKRFSGNVSLGLSLAQSNSQQTLTTQANLLYQDQKNNFAVTSNSQFASQQETSNTNELTVKSSFFRRIGKTNWYNGAIANFLSSSEQQISLETTLGGAYARRLIFTNKTNLTGIAGLGYTNVRATSGSTSSGKTNTLDSAFAIQYSTFRFDSTTFNTSFWIYPSLSSPGRLRLTLNQNLYYKFFGDFYVSVSFFDNYDNQPVIGAPANNIGASTGLGWSFP